MSVIFENVWMLLTVAGVALVAAYIVRQAKPEWGYWPLLVPIAIAGVAVAVDAAVLTDKEAIRQLIAEAKQAAVNDDIDAMMALISPTYIDQSGRTKDDLEQDAHRYLRYTIEKVKTQSHQLTIDGSTAQSELNFVVHFDTTSQDEMIGSLIFVGMTLKYEKIGDRWLISGVNDLTVNNDPFQ